MAVLNRQMFRQPFPVVRRQLGTPQEGETAVSQFNPRVSILNARAANTENLQGQNELTALIEKTNEIIGTLNKMVSEQGIPPNKAAEIINIITTERRKPNPNLELLDDFYNRIVIGNQGYGQGYEVWKEDETQAKEFMNTPMALERQMGSPPMGEQVNANNVGIMK
jgi:hypothetical protein